MYTYVPVCIPFFQVEQVTILLSVLVSGCIPNDQRFS